MWAEESLNHFFSIGNGLLSLFKFQCVTLGKLHGKISLCDAVKILKIRGDWFLSAFSCVCGEEGVEGHLMA